MKLFVFCILFWIFFYSVMFSKSIFFVSEQILNCFVFKIKLFCFFLFRSSQLFPFSSHTNDCNDIFYSKIWFFFNNWLFQSSVDLEPRDRNRRTPMDLAAKHGHEDIIKFLENEKRRRNTFLPVFLDIWWTCFLYWLLYNQTYFGQKSVVF